VADDFPGVAGFDRLDRVAGIDRALERVGIDHARHIRDHHHVEKRGHAGHHVLGVGGGGGNDMVIFIREADDQRGGGFGQAVAEAGIFGDQHARHAVDPGRRLACGCGRGTGGQNGDVTQRPGGGDGLGGGVQRQLAIVHFGKEKNSHYTAPACLSFATSSSTEPTISPALRVGGSSVRSTSSRGATSTP
jgi:hypothetical protein